MLEWPLRGRKGKRRWFDICTALQTDIFNRISEDSVKIFDLENFLDCHTSRYDQTSSAEAPAPSVSVYIWACLTQSYLFSAADIMLGDAFGHRVESSVENKAMKISRSKQALLKKRGRNVHSKHNKASANSNKSSFKSPLTTHEELKPAQSKTATNKQQVTCVIIALVITGFSSMCRGSSACSGILVLD